MKNNENSRGYLRISLKKNKKTYRFFVHRLVAEHFIHKPIDCNIVNHLDCNPHNNNVENLEWTTYKGNSQYMKNLGRNKRTPIWIARLTKTERMINSKKVIGTPLNGGKILTYDAVNDVRKDGFQPSCVSNCCNNIRQIHKGYMWRFRNE